MPLGRVGTSNKGNYAHYRLDFIELSDYLSQFGQGSVHIQVPGKGADWWPDEVLERQWLFDHFADNLFSPLCGCGHPVFTGASEKLYSQMDRYKVKTQGTDEHFDATAKNYRQAIPLMMMAAGCTRFLGCLAEVAQEFLQQNGRALPGETYEEMGSRWEALGPWAQ